MNDLTAHEIQLDAEYSKGYDRAAKLSKKKMCAAMELIGHSIQTLLAVGTSEDDETIKELQKAFNLLS
jgi:hypothetical protein